MAKTYLETDTVHHNFETYSYENVRKELSAAHDSAGEALLSRYPDTFPALYAIKNRHLDEDVTFSFREVPAYERQIVPESWDVLPSGTDLELQCDLAGAGKFAISVEPYDKAGENEKQLRGRINFAQKTIDDLNAENLKKILEFCEKHGLGVYDITLPYKDGIIDVHEKLASLTQDFLKPRQQENVAHPGPSVDTENTDDFENVQVQAQGNIISPVTKTKTKATIKKGKTVENIRDDLIEMLENDLHKTRNLTYFEQTKYMNGRKTYVFSLYDKPDKHNLDKDGRRDKNDIPVPTYQYRLYISQDPKSGEFFFGFATPGGKKIDDAMAGDFLGIVKKTGATHVNFSNLHNAEKGVWLVACAEKGLTPIGISINTAKAKMMVEAAKKKLTDEEFITFKRNLAEQMLENAAAKCKDKNDPTFGLSKSERIYIETLRAAYDFENFRLAYEADDGLYNAVLTQIDKGSRDTKEGAATTFGGMQTLRTVFDIYNHYQSQTFGEYLSNTPAAGNMALTADERRKLRVIPATTPMTDLTTEQFMLIYNTLLPRHIKNSKKEIIQALEREDCRKGPKRASNVVLASDLFPKYKGALNEINIILTRQKGLDALTLPNEHKGLEYTRVEAAPAQNTAAPQTPEKSATTATPAPSATPAIPQRTNETNSR